MNWHSGCAFNFTKLSLEWMWKGRENLAEWGQPRGARDWEGEWSLFFSIFNHWFQVRGALIGVWLIIVCFRTAVICIKFWWVYAMKIELWMNVGIFQLNVWMWVFSILYKWFVSQLGFLGTKIVPKLCLYDCV